MIGERICDVPEGTSSFRRMTELEMYIYNAGLKPCGYIDYYAAYEAAYNEYHKQKEEKEE